MGMEYEDYGKPDILGIAATGMPDRIIPSTAAEEIDVNVIDPKTGVLYTKGSPEAVPKQKFYVVSGTPPAMSTYTATAGNKQVMLTLDCCHGGYFLCVSL